MRRRKSLGLVGAAAAWPLGAGAQQPTMPTIAYLSSRSMDFDGSMLVALSQGRHIELE